MRLEQSDLLSDEKSFFVLHFDVLLGGKNTGLSEEETNDVPILSGFTKDDIGLGASHAVGAVVLMRKSYGFYPLLYQTSALSGGEMRSRANTWEKVIVLGFLILSFIQFLFPTFHNTDRFTSQHTGHVSFALPLFDRDCFANLPVGIEQLGNSETHQVADSEHGIGG